MINFFYIGQRIHRIVVRIKFLSFAKQIAFQAAILYPPQKAYKGNNSNVATLDVTKQTTVTNL